MTELTGKEVVFLKARDAQRVTHDPATGERLVIPFMVLVEFARGTVRGVDASVVTLGDGSSVPHSSYDVAKLASVFDEEVKNSGGKK